MINISKLYLIRNLQFNKFERDTGEVVLPILKRQTRYTERYRLRYAQIGTTMLSVAILTLRNLYKINPKQM